MSDRHDRIRELFVDAVEIPPEDRGAFLDQACGQDSGLRSEVERLLSAGADAATFPTRPSPESSGKPQFSPGKELAGRFRVVRFIASGGMGDVYEVEDLELHENVALKTIRPAVANAPRALSRFKREIQYAKRVTHPNVCRIYDWGSHKDGANETVFLTMELLRGETLAAFLRTREKLSPQEALPLITQMGDALSAAHQAGIIHRDFKTSNVILEETASGRRAVVTDFGLARPSSHVDDGSLTETGRLVGTPEFMAPEQLTQGQLTPATDVYALGLVLYEMLTGHRPFAGDTPVGAALKRLREPAPSPAVYAPGLDARWQAVILRCLEREPGRRFQSPHDVVRSLTTTPAGVSEADISTVTELRWRLFSRRPLLRVLAMAALLAVAAAGWLWWWKPAQRPPPEALRWYQEGTNAFRDGTYFKASKALERAVMLAPRYALAHARLAEAWMELDYADKAREEMLRANPPGARSNLLPAEESYLEAVRLTLTRDFAGAAAQYREILKRASDADLPGAYVDLGRAYENNRNRKEAIQTYEEATRRGPQYAAAFLRLGVLYGQGQDASKAAHAFDQAESLYRALSNVEGITEVLCQRATALQRMGRPQEARGLAEQAISVARTSGNVHQQITALLQLSSIDYALADSSQARQSAAEALDLARKNGLENLTTRGLIQLGNAEFVRGGLEQAKQYFNQALAYARRYKSSSEMNAMFSLASVLIQQGNVDDGLRNLEPALNYYQQTGSLREAAQGFLLLARAKRKQGDYEGALRASGQQLQLAQKMGNRALVSLAEGNLGAILSEQQRFPEALEHNRQYYAAAQALVDQNGTGYALSNMGDQLARLGRYREAQEALRKSQAIADRPDGDRSSRAHIHLAFAEIALSRRRFSEAGSEARRALDAGSQDRDVAIEAHRLLAISAALAGNRPDARQHADQALHLAENSGMAPRLAEALLALAEVLLETGDAHSAADPAMRAQQIFTKSGQTESEWRALLIAARAAAAERDLTKASQLASRASASLGKLALTWPADDYRTYSTRPDIQRYRTQLERLST